MDSTESAQELENAIRAHISFLEHAKRLVQAQIEERRKSIEKTKLELQTLRTANNCFDQIFQTKAHQILQVMRQKSFRIGPNYR